MHDLSKHHDILPAAQFFDRYSIEVDGQNLDARCAAERVMLRRPAWIGWLMALRNLMVRPFGLKTGPADMPAGLERIGLFPLIDESPSRAIPGEVCSGFPSGIAQKQKAGAFPRFREERKRSSVVLGLDDRHLDFRLLVEVNELGNGRQSVSASTFVATHNLLGRAYLAIVMPFHRIIVPAMLSRVGAVS